MASPQVKVPEMGADITLQLPPVLAAAIAQLPDRLTQLARHSFGAWVEVSWDNALSNKGLKPP